MVAIRADSISDSALPEPTIEATLALDALPPAAARVVCALVQIRGLGWESAALDQLTTDLHTLITAQFAEE